jgi:hypothetical protein
VVEAFGGIAEGGALLFGRRRCGHGQAQGAAGQRSFDHGQRRTGPIIKLMRRNLVDEYVLLIHPLVLGMGRRLFGGRRPDDRAPARRHQGHNEWCCDHHLEHAGDQQRQVGHDGNRRNLPKRTTHINTSLSLQHDSRIDG